jgi:hypothetical protein
MKTEPDNFAAFILTHGRPDSVVTYKALRKAGYTGRIFIVVDDTDKLIPEYKARYGKDVIVFDKEAIAQTFDGADNFTDRRVIVYARNAAFEIAKELGIKYFIQLDDDYTAFNFKFDTSGHFGEWPIKNLDGVFEALLNYYKKIPALTIAMAQNGDFIGGGKSGTAQKVGTKRKAMNTFICSTDRPFKFVGRINEDVNTYVNLGGRGELFLQINNVAIIQKQTQSNKGGMTDVYLAGGTYLKSFYTVIFNPASVKVAIMGEKHPRLHHKIRWRNTVPEILDEKHKK